MAIFGRRRFWAAVAVLWLITLGMIGLGRFIPASPLALQDTPNTQLITNPAVWMIDPRTGAALRLRHGNDSLPIWSSDGQSYITNTWQSGYYYEAHTLRGEPALNRFADVGAFYSSSVVWSPDGRYLMGILQTPTRRPPAVYDSHTQQWRTFSGDAYQVLGWSPDSSAVLLAFILNAQPTAGVIRIADGTGFYLPPLSESNSNIIYQWSPDGRYIAAYDKYYTPFSARLYVIPPTPDATYTLIADDLYMLMPPLWLNNDELVVISAWAVERVNILTGEHPPLPDLADGNSFYGHSSLALSPDGNTLAVALNLNGIPSLRLIDLPSNTWHEVGSYSVYHKFEWSPDGHYLAMISDKDTLLVIDRRGRVIYRRISQSLDLDLGFKWQP